MKNAMTLVGPLLRNFFTEQLLVLGRLFIELGRLCSNLARALLAWDD